MRKRNVIILIVVLIGVAVVLGYVFFIRVFGVPGGSMANTIIPGDRVIGVRSYGSAVERGEIVVVQYPEDSTYYLSRVVGLPGETIQLRERTVYIDGRPLAEEKVLTVMTSPDEPLSIRAREGSGPYSVFYDEDVAPEASDAATFGVNEPFRIPAGHYFVMGDNRDNTEDSRYRGTVPAQLIWGTVSVIYFSTDMKTGDSRWDRTFKRIQ